ncbi:MAG TPA: hypothetical protein VGI57_04530 [Usitatibacter sp.]|jgi:hypothetical protein
MNEMNAQAESQESEDTGAAEGKEQWETPKLEDVSEQVMAQPYIRFT